MKIVKTATLLALYMALNLYSGNVSAQSQNLDNNQMNSYLSIFEIPALDLPRAVKFYESILDIQIEVYDMPDMQMGVLPYEGQMVTGIIIKGDGYEPSENGTTVYFNAGEDLQIILDRVEKSGGKVVLPKTAHADESGFFAIFLDPEGNRLGLNSPN